MACFNFFLKYFIFWVKNGSGGKTTDKDVSSVAIATVPVGEDIAL